MSEAAIIHDRVVNSLKAAAWERAKGALMEIVALEGSKTGGFRNIEKMKHEVIEDEFKAFIADIEEKEYNL